MWDMLGESGSSRLASSGGACCAYHLVSQHRTKGYECSKSLIASTLPSDEMTFHCHQMLQTVRQVGGYENAVANPLIINTFRRVPSPRPPRRKALETRLGVRPRCKCEGHHDHPAERHWRLPAVPVPELSFESPRPPRRKALETIAGLFLRVDQLESPRPPRRKALETWNPS